ELIPIIEEKEKYKICTTDFIKEIEEICSRKVIYLSEEIEKINTDIVIIAPCSRASHKKNCKSYI
ncbi:MAG: hypothetical protein HFJ51_05755, partial [Clostridia bacterium]|nr:hypothetical protein [Clostridia bacterium]